MSNTVFANHTGFTQIDNEVFYLQSTLSASAFSLFIRIYRATQGYGVAVKALSNSYLQKTTNLSKNTVTRSIKELEDLGVLLVKRRARLSSYYQISVKGVSKLYNTIKSELSEGVESLELDLEGNESASLPVEQVVEVEVEQSTTVEALQSPDNSFEIFWGVYDKKVGKEPSKRLWVRLRDSDKEAIMKHLDKYVQSTPEKQFRKDPANYLKDRVWEDEVIEHKFEVSTPENKSQQPPNFSAPVLEVRDVVRAGSEADEKINAFLRSFGKKGETYA